MAECSTCAKCDEVFAKVAEATKQHLDLVGSSLEVLSGERERCVAWVRTAMQRGYPHEQLIALIEGGSLPESMVKKLAEQS